VLVDSGSSHSFLNATFAADFLDVQPLPAPVSVRVADGNILKCSSQIIDAEWSLQGHLFHSTLRILPLGSYEL